MDAMAGLGCFRVPLKPMALTTSPRNPHALAVAGRVAVAAVAPAAWLEILQFLGASAARIRDRLKVELEWNRT